MATNERFDWLWASTKLAEIAPKVLSGFPGYIIGDIDDIIQDTLLKLYRSEPHEKPSLRLLAVMIKHTAIDRMRARGRTRSLDDFEHIESRAGEPTDVELRTELWERLRAGLACLSFEERSVLMRFYRGRVPIRQLADEAGVGYSAMAVRLHRIKKKLRAELRRLGSL